MQRLNVLFQQMALYTRAIIAFFFSSLVERPWLEYGEMDRGRRCTSIVSSRQVRKHNVQHVLDQGLVIYIIQPY